MPSKNRIKKFGGKQSEDKNGSIDILITLRVQGRQLRLKEQYEQAAQGSQNGKDGQHLDASVVDPEKIKHIKDIFEKGGSEERTSQSKSPDLVVDPEKLRSLKGLFESGGENSSNARAERQEEIIPAGLLFAVMCDGSFTVPY